MDGGRDRHLATRLAEGHRVSAHWVRVLGRRERRGERPRPVGRPRTPEAERARVRALVEAQLDLQGEVGQRAVLAGIAKGLGAGEKVSAMLVQQETTAAKRERRARRQREVEAAREGHEVLARDAVWAQDAFHAGRVEGGGAALAEAATDRGSGSTVLGRVGPPLSGEGLVERFEQACGERGGPPLVWQADRGPANRSEAMARHLETRRVVRLLSRPHTPTDNPVAENRNRELEEASGLGCGVELASLEQGQAMLEPARRQLDERRLRRRHGYRTAAEVDRVMARADRLVDRDAFYAEARSAMAEAVRGLTDAEDVARAEQRAVWATLERHGLARRHVGPRRTPCREAPPVAPGQSG